MICRSLITLLTSVFLSMPLWADERNLNSIMNVSFTNTETTLLELIQLDPETLSLQERRWYYLNKALSEVQLSLYEDMSRSLRSAEPLFNAGLEGLKNQNYQQAKATFFFLQARYANNSSSFSQAIYYAEAARSLSTAHNLSAIYVLATSELANAYVNISNNERALTLNYQAYSQAKTLNRPDIFAYVNQIYGNIYHDIGAYSDAIIHFKESLQDFQSLGYSAFASTSLFGIASSYRYQLKYDLAIEYFEKYKKSVLPISFAKSHYQAFYGLGMTLAELPNCRQALPNLQRAIEIGGPEDWDFELFKKISSCNVLMGDITEAENAFTQAKMTLSKLPDLHNTKWAVELTHIESTIENAKNNSRVAYELLLKYNLDILTINRNLYSNRLTDIRLTLGAQKKDIEIQLLQERSEHQERQASLYIYSIFAGATLLSVLIFLLTLYYRKSKKFHLLSMKDSLTGIYNRRHIFSQLEKMYGESEPTKKKFSVLCIDIDDFKLINDSFGHAAGDSVIKHIASLSEKTLRMTDILGRIGGEEFMAILPRTKPEQAESIAQRLLTQIESTPTTLADGTVIHVTISIGLCHSKPEITSAQAIYNEADLALYQSKHKGKNRLSIAIHS